MQINIPKPDLTKPEYAREDEDRFCTISKDQLLTFLEESNWGQDVDKWRQHFVLAPSRNEPVCRECSRLINHHHTNHTRPHQPMDRLRKRAPITCGAVQSRLLRCQERNNGGMLGNLMADFMFVQNPETGETYCAACNYRVDQHPNGQDIADAMTNALGFGGLMNGLSGGKLGGDHRRTDLSPEEQAYLDHQEELRQLLSPERSRGCPYTQEDWTRHEIDTCYQRYREMYNLYFTKGNQDPHTKIAPTVCVLCRKEKRYHATDYSMEGGTEQEAWQPKSKLPCPHVKRYFENQRNGLAGQFIIKRNPLTGVEVCGICLYPLAEHDDGVDQGEQMKNAIMGAFFGGGGGVGGGGFNMMFGGQQQQQQQQQQQRFATAGTSSNNQQQPQPQAQSTPGAPVSGYQQFGVQDDSMNGGGDGRYIEVMQMEMCCGCIPRMVKKRIYTGRQQQQQQQRPPQQQSMFAKMVI